MDTFTFSDPQFVPTPPKNKEQQYMCLTLPQRSVISQLDKHLRLPAKQQLLHREFIVITGEHGSGKKELLKHMLFLLDTAAHTDADFAYLRIRPGTYEVTRFSSDWILTFGGLPAFDEEYNGNQRLRNEWGLSMCASDMCEVKLVLIEDFHNLSASDFSCLEYYLRKVANEFNCNAPFGNCSIICLGNIYMPSPLTEDPIFLETNGPWAVLGKNSCELYKHNITSAYFLRQSKQVICPEYKGFLDRLKTGFTSEEDFEKIKSRMISKLKTDEIARFQGVLRLFPYGRDVEAYNMIENHKLADEFAARHPLYPSFAKVIIVQNGFEKLHLAPGCKVTLSRDINRARCLKFGCVGTFISACIRRPETAAKVVRVAAKDIPLLFVKFDCCPNHDMGDGPIEYRFGTVIEKTWTKAYCFKDGRNKFVRTFPFVNSCGATHAAVQNVDLVPKLAIKLGQNELRENQDYSVFSKLTSFSDLIILDSYVTAKRMKVGSVKKTLRHQEYERLAGEYENKVFNGNVVKNIIQRSIGGRGRPKRTKVTLDSKTYIDVDSSPSAKAIRQFFDFKGSK